MQAGKRDRLIEIRMPVITQDEYGGTVETFAKLADVWAERLPAGGRQFLQAGQFQPGLQVIWRIRYREDFDESARIIDSDGREFSILSIHMIGRHKGLEVWGKLP